ncbi:hypothetical protein C8R43DRAFT_1167960 [Mycena crocata]|nr:hypothetical protein C8R43DRAFT_1167960 [Mycena crocata]
MKSISIATLLALATFVAAQTAGGPPFDPAGKKEPKTKDLHPCLDQWIPLAELGANGSHWPLSPLAPVSTNGEHTLKISVGKIQNGQLRDYNLHSRMKPFQPYCVATSKFYATRCDGSKLSANLRRTPRLRVELTRSVNGTAAISFRNHHDMEKVLVAARVSNVGFCCKTLRIDFDGTFMGGVYNVDVEFRDPWRIMTHWDDLPGDGDYPSCFLGIHIWLDKGLVSTKVKMHPILIRGCWINSETWNGSGNGGSALVGFVKMPENMRQIDPRGLSTSEREDYDRLKRLIYRGVCETIMSSLQHRSHRGEALRFGDGIIRVAHPGDLIESMDFEEVSAWLAIRNSRSLHPCPQCLVHHDDLQRLSRSYPVRTPEKNVRSSCEGSDFTQDSEKRLFERVRAP